MDRSNVCEINIKIPPDYHAMHDYLIFCTDTLVSILHYADKVDLNSETLQFKSKDKLKEFEQIIENTKDGDDLWHDWLISHGFKDKMYYSYYKHTLFSLLADFCHFIFESINNAAKMKVAVAYTLLRKPLRETLYYFEWLYTDRNEIIELLINGESSALAIKKNKAKELADSIQKTLGFDCYFDFRYEKNSPESLERIWNQANHIITNDRYAKTSNGNLNFIFLDSDNTNEFINYYYLLVPNIMSYVLELTVIMFEDMSEISDYTKIMNRIIRIGKLTLLNKNELTISEIIKSFKNQLPFTCPSCGHEKALNSKVFKQLLINNHFCKKCNYSIDTSMYMFDWEKTISAE